MLEIPAEQAHELHQVCRLVVLLQELENGSNNCGIMPSQQMKHLMLRGYFEMTHLSYSLAVILSLSHISWCQVITGPQDWGSHPQVDFCLEVILLPFEIRSEVLLLFTGEAMKSANCEGTKSQYNPPIHLHYLSENTWLESSYQSPSAGEHHQEQNTGLTTSVQTDHPGYNDRTCYLEELVLQP